MTRETKPQLARRIESLSPTREPVSLATLLSAESVEDAPGENLVRVDGTVRCDPGILEALQENHD